MASSGRYLKRMKPDYCHRVAKAKRVMTVMRKWTKELFGRPRTHETRVNVPCRYLHLRNYLQRYLLIDEVPGTSSHRIDARSARH